MIDEQITDEYIEAERRAFEHFHSLRKYNSSRRERQAAYAVVHQYLWRRIGRAMRMHPIAPSLRWWDFMDEAPEGWTCPAMRTLEPDEVDELFPGARAALAIQCDDIPAYRIVFDDHGRVGGKLRLSVPMRGLHTRHANMTWLPEMGIWRRYRRDVKSKPYKATE